VNIDRALGIDGWMSPGELEWLAKQAEKHDLIAEIGSWMGRSTAAMSDNTDGRIFAIDTWAGSDEPAHHEILADKGPNWLFSEFKRNITDNVTAIRMTSLEAAAYFERRGAKFDMIFLDGAHDTESVRADIAAWLPRLADGGLFCGHDYFTTVKEAVDEVLEVDEAHSIWIMRGRK